MLRSVEDEVSNMGYRRLHCIIFLLMLVFSESLSQKCALKENMPDLICVCEPAEELTGWLYTCITNSNFEVSFSLKYVMNSYVAFECGEQEPDYLSLLNQLDLSEIQTFTFKACPLPNSSYSEILPDVEKYPVEQIKIEQKRDNRTFSADVFANITEHLTSLILTKNKIEVLPESIFNDFTKLKYLSLSDNHLQVLPDKLFSNLQKLIVLEIANNALINLTSNVFKNLSHLEKLYLYKNKLKKLPDDVFQDLENLKVLDLADNHLILLSNGIFHSLPQMISIRLRGNWLGIVPEGLFINSSNLQNIDLSLNRFMEPLPAKLLRGLTRLENVSINDCNLTQIHETFFSYCPNITHLYLQSNRFTRLPEGIFKNNTMLRELNLNFNYITELEKNLFPNQKYLEKLSLFRNNISSIPTGFFKYTRNIKTLVLGRNHIKNASELIFHDLPNLERLDMSFNNLTYFKLDFNEFVTYIDLKHNDLTEMPPINWEHHLKLEAFDLEYNKLTHLKIPVLYSTNKRPTLNIAHNGIQTVSVQDVALNDDVIKGLPSEDYEKYVETYIYLNSNPFVCDCKIHDFFNYLRRSHEAHTKTVRFAMLQNLTCHEPKGLAGKPIILLNSSQLICDLVEECPSPCHCNIRAQDNARIVNCSNHRLKSLPSTIPHNTSILFFQNNMLSRMDGFNARMWENITSLYLDENQITSLDKWDIPPKLRTISLQGNRIRHLPHSFMNFISNAKDFRITLSGNLWNCNCSTINFKKWLAEHYPIVEDVKTIMCSNRLKWNNTLIRRPILVIPDEVICPINDWPYKVQLISVTVICVILALMLFVVSVLYYRNKQTVIAYVYIHMHNVFTCFFNEEDIDEDKIFDAFVSYSGSDRDVAFKLISELEEKEPHFQLCIHERNWIAGNQISWNIFNSVHNSRRTILVISKDFLESIWFQVEFHTAYYQMLEDKIDRLIIIIKGELPPKDSLDKDLQYLLSTKTYLVWEEKWFWEKLKYAMPHKKQQILQNDVMALKDRPSSEKIKPIDNQIAILSSSSTKATGKAQEVIHNGTNLALNLVTKETISKK